METLNAILKVNSQGTVLENALPDCFLGCLKQSEALSDHVHINDRIIFLSFLADVRENRLASPITIRMNGRDRTRFISVLIHCLSVHENSIALAIEANSKEIGSLGMNAVSPFTQAAHEMRTPLNAILGFADLLDYLDQQNKGNTKRHEYIAMIKKAGNHLLDIVNKTLKDRDRSTDDIVSEICSVGSILTETLELTLPLHGHRKIAVKGAATPVACCLDALSFRQICFNLISNAIKYSRDDGHIGVTIAILDNEYCEITVEDDGIGMDEQHIARLGLPFLRASDAVACKIEGVGLGLAMVFDLVKRAKGQITFESEKGKGTRVRLLLPIMQENSAGSIQTSKIDIVGSDAAANNGYILTPETQLGNNGKTTKNTTKPNRKTA